MYGENHLSNSAINTRRHHVAGTKHIPDGRRDRSKHRGSFVDSQQELYVPLARRKQLMKANQKQLQQQEHPQVEQDENRLDHDKEKKQKDDKLSLMNSSMKDSVPDHSVLRKQRETWDEQQRVIHGTINRLNKSTIKPLIHDLFAKVNLIRLRGVLIRSILLATVSSIQYSSVYAALMAVINTKLPEIGELLVHRSILLFRKFYKRKEKDSCIAIVMFLGHLFHQSIIHEIIILQILTLLLEDTVAGGPTNDSVEVAIQLIQLTGYSLLEVSPTGIRAIFERLRTLLHEGIVSKRIEVQLEELFQLRKKGFLVDNPYYPPIPSELDLVEQDDQITFDEIMLDDESIVEQDHLDKFQSVESTQFDHDNEEWSKIRNEILGIDGSDNSDESDGEGETDSGSDSEDEGARDDSAMVPIEASTTTDIVKTDTTVVQDLSEADLVHLRRTIYLTIMSSATYEECAHKLAKIEVPIGKEEELINMLIECCSQERTFLRYYGMIAARFCLLDDRWYQAFVTSFTLQYNTIHRLETNKLRNVAKLFAHLLHTDSLSWDILNIIHINEDETTSSSRIFIKILLQEMTEHLGMVKLRERFETNDPSNIHWYEGMFPKDNIRNTKYAINFFTSIGLGPLTDNLREYLKNAPKLILAQLEKEAELQAAIRKDEDDSSSVSTASSSSSSGSSSSSSRSSRSSSSGSSSSFSSSSSSYSSSSSSSTRSSYSSKSSVDSRIRRKRHRKQAPDSNSRSDVRRQSTKKRSRRRGSSGSSSDESQRSSTRSSSQPKRSSRDDRRSAKQDPMKEKASRSRSKLHDEKDNEFEQDKHRKTRHDVERNSRNDRPSQVHEEPDSLDKQKRSRGDHSQQSPIQISDGDDRKNITLHKEQQHKKRRRDSSPSSSETSSRSGSSHSSIKEKVNDRSESRKARKQDDLEAPDRSSKSKSYRDEKRRSKSKESDSESDNSSKT